MEEAAGLTGFSVAYLSFVERRLRQPSAKAKLTIARRLGVSVREIFPPDPVPELEEAAV